VQRRDGPRRLRDYDDDDDEGAVTLRRWEGNRGAWQKATVRHARTFSLDTYWTSAPAPTVGRPLPYLTHLVACLLTTYLLILILYTETDEKPDVATESATAVPAVGNPEYLDRDVVEPWSAAGASADVIGDEGSYLTCGATHDYYDYSHAGGRQLIAA